MRTLHFILMTLIITTSTAWGETPKSQTQTEIGVETGRIDFEIPDMVEVRVKSGESLYEIARWSDVKMEALEQLNGIDLAHGLKNGQSLVIPMTKNAQVSFMKSRNRFHDRRKDRYLNRRGGLAELREYRVRTGDTVWELAKTHGGLPLWLVKTYNPGVDLSRVRIGDTLALPILGDTIDALEHEESEEDDSADAYEYDEDELGC